MAASGWASWILVVGLSSVLNGASHGAASSVQRSPTERRMAAERAAARAAALAAAAGVGAASGFGQQEMPSHCSADGGAEVAQLRARLAERDSEVASLKKRLDHALLGRMEPTRVSVQGRELPLARQPSFEELHQALFGRAWDPKANLWTEFPNHYEKEPNFNYTHSPFWEDYKVGQFWDEIAKMLNPNGEWQPRFIVEVGTFFGMSAIRWAQELDHRNLTKVPILCVDPFTGDLNMWLNKEKPVWKLLDVQHARPLLFEQFMANVKFMLDVGKVSATHIIPFQNTAVVAARWLHLQGFHPDMVFLDSAHEVDETYLELALFYNLLAEGGVLFGDDYQWPSVRRDVDSYVAYHNLKLFKDQQQRLWAIVKKVPEQVP